MKVRTHVLILMLISFGGSLILGTLAFVIYSNYREKRENMDTATNMVLDQGTFFLATRFSTSVSEYINAMGVSKNAIYDLTDDQIILIKESYNRFIDSYSRDENFRNQLGEIEFNDDSNLATDIEKGLLAEQIKLFEQSLFNWGKLTIQKNRDMTGYGLAKRIENAFEGNSFVSQLFLQNAKPFLKDKEKYKYNLE